MAIDDLFRAGSGALQRHTKYQNDLTKLIVKLARNVDAAARAFSNSKRNDKQNLKSYKKLISEMEAYQLGIRKNIPLKRIALTESMTSVQRAVSIIRENKLEETRPLGDLPSSVLSATDSFRGLLQVLSETDKSFEKWPDDNSDLTTQKKLISALHSDLQFYYQSAIQMLTNFSETLKR